MAATLLIGPVQKVGFCILYTLLDPLAMQPCKGVLPLPPHCLTLTLLEAHSCRLPLHGQHLCLFQRPHLCRQSLVFGISPTLLQKSISIAFCSALLMPRQRLTPSHLVRASCKPVQGSRPLRAWRYELSIYRIVLRTSPSLQEPLLHRYVKPFIQERLPIGDGYLFIPIFPPCEGLLDCILVPPETTGTPIAVRTSHSQHFRPCIVLEDDTADGIAHKLQLPAGSFYLDHIHWTAPSDGLFPGMTLDFKAAAIEARPVATPCRTSRAHPPPAPLSAPAVLSLDTSLQFHACLAEAPKEAPIRTHACLDTLLAALDSFQLHTLRRDIPASVALQECTCLAFAALESFDPSDAFDCLHVYVDGSYCEATHSAGWAVVVLPERRATSLCPTLKSLFRPMHTLRNLWRNAWR